MQISRLLFAKDRVLALGSHLTFFFLFTGLFTTAGLFIGFPITQWTLPITFLLYIVANILFESIRRQKLHITADLIVFIAVSLVLYSAAHIIFTNFYDTSYDGQSYHLSGIIALMEGWNPIRDGGLPITLLEGEAYVQGYPKLLWEFYASLALFGGSLGFALILNIAIGLIGFCCFYYFLANNFKISYLWILIISLLSTLQIYFLQQSTTFMADGTSYELGLAAASILATILFKSQSSRRLEILFFALLILLLGSKFSNAYLCLLLGAIYLIHLYRTRTLKLRSTWLFIGLTSLVALTLLWTPFVTNFFRYNSPVYPMNLPSQSANLKYDNIPPNIKESNGLSLLFYGVFSQAQPPSAGDVKSPENIAQLKVPFSFTASELASVGNFQGRVGSAGVLFSGVVALSVILLIYCIVKAQDERSKKIVKYTLFMIGLILFLSLLNPIPNKIRYAPFLTLLPIVTLVSSLLLLKKDRIIKVLQILVITTITMNILLASIFLFKIRTNEFAQAGRQMTILKTSPAPIAVVSKDFYSILYRLQKENINFKLVEHCPPSLQGIEAANSFKTAYYCLDK